MRFLVRLAVVVALFIILGVVFSLFLPSDLEFEKSALIAADKTAIEKQLESFRYQKINGYEVKVAWEVTSSAQKTKVMARVNFLLGINPLTKFSTLFSKTELEQAFQQKFDSTVLVLEELPQIQGVVVEKKHLEKDIWFLAIRDTINPMNMNNVHGKFYEEIKQHLQQKSQPTSAPPMVIYHFWSDTLVDIEVGVSVADSSVTGKDRIQLKRIEQTDVVTAMHYGAYERMPETYFGINEWMRKNKVVVTGPPWEVYLTDPSTEADPRKWKTAIFFPIE